MTDVWRFYERFVTQWDRDRGRGRRDFMERRYLDELTSRLRNGSRILDLGCGTGEPIARHLIESGYDVTGVDAAPSMIALCRQRVAGGTWIEADMRSLALERRFDAIIAWDSFFHLAQDEQRAMFPIFERHIAPGGMLLFTSGPRADEHLSKLYGEDLFNASLAPDEYRALLGSTGFHVLRFEAEDPKCGGHTVWLAQSVA